MPFGDEEEDDVLAPKEPQVTSMEPEERKAARSLRIKRRQDALKKAEQLAEQVAVVEEEEAGLVEQATAAAAEELQRLSLEGTAKVTNVKVTTDEREVFRRNSYFKQMEESLKKIEEEAASAHLQYEVISDHWEHILSVKDPLDIDAEMKEQKMKCDHLLNEKDELIAFLKEELKNLDLAYYVDLNKQDNDIKELSDRIEKQITIMQRAYQKQLSLIDAAANIERDAMIDHNNKRWEALNKQRDKEEMIHLEFKFEQLEEHKEIVEAIMWDHHEKYRVAKIELETLTQELQKELEKLKVTCLINTEKIGYTYQILKKREEENIFVRSEQKRKLNKMSDVTNDLRHRIQKAAEDGAVEEMKADSEIKKLTQTMDDLEKKSNQFSHTNNYKFAQVWRMTMSKCHDLVKQLRHGEVALHAHVLAEPPPPPPPPMPKNPLVKYEREHELKTRKEEVVITQDPMCPETAEAKEKLVRHILQLVADNTGFLVENRLLTLIEKYQLSSRNLCTLDSIFMALEIESEQDINLLCDTFLNYSYCPVCIAPEEPSEGQSETAQETIAGDSQSIYNKSRPGTRGGRQTAGMSVARTTSGNSSSRFPHYISKVGELPEVDQLLLTEAEEILQKCGDPQAANVMVTGGTPDAGSLQTRGRGTRAVTVASQPTKTDSNKPITNNRFLCPMGHHLEIEPPQVLTALSDFISVFVPSDKKKLNDILENLKPPSFETPSRLIPPVEIDLYWEQWKSMFSAEKHKFWDGMLTGLNNYLEILQEREKIHEEVAQLRLRNAALRRLIRGALPELPAVVPHYARTFPSKFVAAMADEAPLAFARLPPI